MKFLFTLTLFISGTQASAQLDDCQFNEFHNGALKLERIRTKSDNCLVILTPRNTSHLTYRSFSFDRFGKFFIFNSFGEGSTSTSTGAKVFYLFPRGLVPSFQVNSFQAQINLASSTEVSVKIENGNLISLSHGSIQIQEAITPDNKGGVTITDWPGVLLDSGFSLGRDPTSRESATSTFIDVLGHRCKVKNALLFDLTSGDPRFRFSDSELPEFLKKHCPLLTLRDPA